MDLLESIWRRITSSILDYEVEETVLVLESSTKKRKFDSQTNMIHIHQYSGSFWESRRFMSILKVIQILIVNLSFKKVTTLRDIYYQDVTLFHKSQKYSNEMIEMIRKSLNASLEDNLSIFPSQKGLVYGNCNIRFKEGACIDLDYTSDPKLIPPISNREDNKIIEITPAPDAVVIIEKDAIFKSFCNFIKKKNYSKHIIVITGKGYPDKLTKKFVHSLSDYNSNAVMLGFMDSDVYGINIFKTYKYLNDDEKFSEIKMILAGVFLLEYEEGWIDISNRDIKMMSNLIKEMAIQLEHCHQSKSLNELKICHRELTRGLFLFKKSEMNVIESNSTAHNYMLHKIESYL